MLLINVSSRRLRFAAKSACGCVAEVTQMELLLVRSFAAVALFEVAFCRRGGARFHGISIAIDHAARSGL